jgi:NTP pyrophosphatase (non-canonical NTP hydrolase)
MQDDLDKILKFQQERDWKQFHSPKNLAISLSIEAAEILEIFQWTNNGNLPEGKRKELEEELADVYYYLLLLAYESGIDIKKAFEDKMTLNQKKYPIDKSKGKSNKYNELK